MSKTIYDVIQRFEVEKGVPRLISTNIQVIEGGEDLMSLAANLLKKLGFYDKFDEKRTSQYIGYRLKNPRKGDKRYQLVLAQRKEGLCISIPQDRLEPYLLNINSHVLIPEEQVIGWRVEASYWILPSKRDNFLNSINVEYWHLFEDFEIGVEREIKGDFYLNSYEGDGWGYGVVFPSKLLDEFQADTLSNDPQSYLIVNSDKLFPYAWQVSISSSEVLEEFLGYFAKTLMIEGGENLMSLAANLLKKLGFYEKFDEKRTSQYIGYRLKNPRKGDKRYQLVLAQRKEGLCISIPQDRLEPYLLKIKSHGVIQEQGVRGENLKASYWILPSKKEQFLNSIKGEYWHLFEEFEIGVKREIQGDIHLNSYKDDHNYAVDWVEVFPSEILDEFQADTLSDDPQSHLIVNSDKLFPYAWQVSISSSEVLEEFLGYFVKILMEAQ